MKTFTRSLETAVKLPLAAAWDIVSLSNMGGVSSTEKVLQEHEKQKLHDDEMERLRDLMRLARR